MSRFRFVDDHRDTYQVKRLCQLVEVSRSGYYRWASAAPTVDLPEPETPMTTMGDPITST